MVWSDVLWVIGAAAWGYIAGIVLRGISDRGRPIRVPLISAALAAMARRLTWYMELNRVAFLRLSRGIENLVARTR